MDGWIEDLLEYHLTRGKPGTSRQYAYDLRVIGRFLRDHRGEQIDGNADVVRAMIGPCVNGQPVRTKVLLRGFEAWAIREGKRDGRPYSQAAVRRFQVSFKALMRAAMELGFVAYEHRVLPKLMEQAPPVRDVRSPGRSAVMRMLSICQVRADLKGRRDELALWLMFANALRVSEVCSIEYPHGVDLDAGTVWISAKGRHDREEIELPRDTQRVLEDYLELRGEAPGRLLNRRDRRRPGDAEPLTTSGLRRVVVELGRQVGARVRPHQLRHAGLTEMARLTNGNDVWVATLSRHRAYSSWGRMWHRYIDDPIYTMREAANIVQRGRIWRHPSAC